MAGEQRLSQELPYHIAFFGRVHPPGVPISINEVDPFVDYSDQEGFLARITPVINNSRVSMECYFNNLVPNYQSKLIYIAVSGVRARIALESFRLGLGTVFSVDWMKDYDGTIRKVSVSQIGLSDMCTSLSTSEDYTRLKDIATGDQAMSLAIDDLIQAQTSPLMQEVSCGRAIEGIRNIIAGQGTEPKKAWPLVREALNIDRTYLILITDNSVPRRHGEFKLIAGATQQEILRRSWTIMDRFFHYRLRGDTRLPLDQFPLLFDENLAPPAAPP